MVEALSKEMVSRGHEVHVATTDVLDGENRYTGEMETEVEGISVHYFKNISNYLAKNLNAYITKPGYSSWLRENIPDFDMVHLHSIFNPFNLTTLRTLNRLDRSCAITPHGSLLEARLKERSLLKKFMLTFFNRYERTAVAEYFALTEGEKEEMIKAGYDEDRIVVIPNGINMNDFQKTTITAKEDAELRKKFGIPKDHKVILLVCRLHKIKGVDLLAEAFVKVAAKRDDVTLVLAGRDDGVADSIRTLAEKNDLTDRIILTGHIDGDEKFGLFAMADVYAQPSRAEGFAISILEACAFSKPVLISEFCYFPDIEEYKAGKIVSLDTDEIADGLLEILKGEEPYGENAHKLVTSKYTWPKVTDRILERYEKLSK